MTGPRKRAGKGQVSKTKQKGTPVAGAQSETLFGGPRGPTPGKTREQKLAELEAAEKAAKARDIMLGAVLEQLEAVDANKLAFIQKDILALIHNALDRGWGKAQSNIDVTSSDGSASMPSVIRLVGPEDSDDS